MAEGKKHSRGVNRNRERMKEKIEYFRLGNKTTMTYLAHIHNLRLGSMGSRHCLHSL